MRDSDGPSSVSSLTSDKNWVTRPSGDHASVSSDNRGFLPDNKEFIGMSRLVIKTCVYTPHRY